MSVKGDCFGNVMQAITRYPDAKIVHGSVRVSGTSNRFHHAWIETNGHVIDPTTNVTMNKQYWYARLNAKPESKYTKTEAQINMLRFRHMGPWSSRSAKHIGSR